MSRKKPRVTTTDQHVSRAYLLRVFLLALVIGVITWAGWFSPVARAVRPATVEITR